MVFLSGQVGWNEQQEIVGPNDLRAQTWQTLRNIETAIKAVGGKLTDIVSMRIYIVEEKIEESHHIEAGLKEFFPPECAPSTTWIGVRALANQDFLIEIEAIGVIED